MKKTTLISLIDMVCPHSCHGCDTIGSILCQCCKNDIIENHTNYCPNCKKILTGTKCKYCHLPITFMVGWRDELIGILVRDLKYGSVRKIGKEIGDILDGILPVFNDRVHIVPLPTIKKHVRERGLDHTMLIAKELAKHRNWVVDPVLERNKNTIQVGANEKIRKKQASKAYKIKKSINKQSVYLLLDDVWTTGSSMKAAIKQLRQSGATKIVVVVLAVSRISKIK